MFKGCDMQKFIKQLPNLPVAVSGLALGIAGIGNVLGIEVDPSMRYICAIIAAVWLLLVLSKKLIHPRVVWSEIAHPVAGSFIPAFDMAIMILADLVTKFSLITGQIMWYVAIIMHILFLVFFIYHRVRDFDLNHMLPSWFVPPIGIVVACVTSSHMGSPEITKVLFYFGFAAYIVMLPIMIYRLIFGDRISDAQLPAFAVIGAPANLCLAGYLTAFNQPDHTVIGFLLALGLITISLVYISMFRINPVRIAFIPIYASYTFPTAIGATALIKYSLYLGVNTPDGKFWHSLGLIEMVIASVIILWVLINMTILVTKNFSKSM